MPPKGWENHPNPVQSGGKGERSLPIETPEKTASVWRLSVGLRGGPGDKGALLFFLFLLHSTSNFCLTASGLCAIVDSGGTSD